MQQFAFPKPSPNDEETQNTDCPYYITPENITLCIDEINCFVALK
jgi:hypothetical protein